MANNYFRFKQFTIQQDKAAMKVTTDSCLFGAWMAKKMTEHTGTPSRLLDIGIGTGLLSLMIAQQNRHFTIDAVEIDRNAYEQAIENVMSSPWKENIQVFHADIKSIEPGKKYDVIISNPPFYENELKAENENKNFAHHNSGLAFSDLFEIIKRQLSPEGHFYLLLPYKRNEEIRKLVFEHRFELSQIVLVRQSVNHSYFRIMLCGKLSSEEREETVIDEMAIRDSNDNYTPAFISLLRDYYLYL